MTKEQYIKTIEVCGTKVDLGLDDYGQCYFIEWIDKNGEKKSAGLGTYNFHYMESIYHMFDERYRELSRKELFGEVTSPEWLELEKYYKMFDEEYKKKDMKDLLDDLDDCIWKLDSYLELDEERELFERLKEISEGLRKVIE